MKKNNKSTKENPIMTDIKSAKKIKLNNNSDDENEIKAFIIIVIVIAILIGIIYGLTELFKKDDITDNPSIVAGKINYDKISVGTLLNRPYDEYYVLVYNSKDSKAVVYSALITKYMQNSEDKDYVKIYYCDLNNKLNSAYYNINNDGKSNTKAKNIDELNFGDLTLLKIEKGKIQKYIEDYNDIKEILK